MRWKPQDGKSFFQDRWKHGRRVGLSFMPLCPSVSLRQQVPTWATALLWCQMFPDLQTMMQRIRIKDSFHLTIQDVNNVHTYTCTGLMSRERPAAFKTVDTAWLIASLVLVPRSLPRFSLLAIDWLLGIRMVHCLYFSVPRLSVDAMSPLPLLPWSYWLLTTWQLL